MNLNFKLDQKDLKILRELDCDCRQSNSEIGKRVGLPKNIVNYRIQQLETKGIISGYHIFVNSALLGRIYARIFLKFNNIAPQREEEIVSELKQIPEITSIISQEGYWNMVLVVETTDIHSLNQLYRDILYKYPDGFRAKNLSIGCALYSFKHNFLWQSKDYSYGINGIPTRNSFKALSGRQQKVASHIVEHDDKDLLILHQLANNARENVVAIAQKVGLSAKTVADRIRKLKSSGVIQEFRVTLNLPLLGKQYFHVFLTLRNMSNRAEQEIISYLKIHPNVLYITQAMGESDLEFEIILDSHNELYEEEKKLRSRFPEFIQDFESTLIYKVHKQTRF